MFNKLPSHNVPLVLIADVLCYLINYNSSPSTEELRRFTGKSEAYIRSSISICKLLNVINEDGCIDKYAESLGRTPDDDLKINVMRKFIQEYEPFITFIQYHLNGATLEESARKVYVSYKFEGKDHVFLKDLFLSWGTTTGIFSNTTEGIILDEKIQKQYAAIDRLEVNLTEDIAIRLYISNRLGDEIFSKLTSAEVSELVDAYLKCSNDARGSIECAGRAFEDFLRRMALSVKIDVSRKNGISEVTNALYNNRDASNVNHNMIHSKQHNISIAIGDIRNMAGHSLEARTMERWNLTTHSAKIYVELVLSTMRSIYDYIHNSIYNF